MPPPPQSCVTPEPSAAQIPPPRRRMAPADRERAIVAEATRYFAEHGLTGGTPELARRIGITQPLLYKYFATKAALIERVYSELFPADWSQRWETLLDDTTVPIRSRLKIFYHEFAETVFTYEHVRLFLYSGLAECDFNQRYYAELTERMFTRIARGLRAEYGAGPPELPVNEVEMELVQSLHAAIYHIFFRRWVHMRPVDQDTSALIAHKVDLFLDGAHVSLRPAPPPPAVMVRAQRKGAR